MHIGDSIFIFLLALVLFGPKKLPEIGRQIGKLLVEFRRASNDFKLQIDEELRTMEIKDQQEKQEKQRLEASAQLGAGDSLAPTILPPVIGEQVAAANPYAVSAPETTLDAAPAEHSALAVSAGSDHVHSAENHPLLAVRPFHRGSRPPPSGRTATPPTTMNNRQPRVATR